MMPTSGRELRTLDGIGLAVDLWEADAPRAAVIVAHGFTAHRRDPLVVGIAAGLHACGLSVVTYDARGHGESGGTCTLGDCEARDVAAAFEVAASLSRRVVLVGASIGAIAALRFAADRDDVAGVVALSCPARWRLHSARSGASALLTRTRPGRWFLGRQTGVRVDRVWSNADPPLVLVARLRCPVALVHGLGDRFVPASEAALLHAAASAKRRIDVVDGMGHGFAGCDPSVIVGAVTWCLDAP